MIFRLDAGALIPDKRNKQRHPEKNEKDSEKSRLAHIKGKNTRIDADGRHDAGSHDQISGIFLDHAVEKKMIVVNPDFAVAVLAEMLARMASGGMLDQSIGTIARDKSPETQFMLAVRALFHRALN